MLEHLQTDKLLQIKEQENVLNLSEKSIRIRKSKCFFSTVKNVDMQQRRPGGGDGGLDVDRSSDHTGQWRPFS